MNDCKFGEIFLVRFHPASCQEIKKFRPAVVVSQIVNQLDERYAMIAPLTSNLSSKKDFEIIVENDGLKYKSKILTWYIRTIDVNRLVKKIGHLSKKDVIILRNNLKKLF